MASRTLQHVLSFPGASSQYYMPVLRPDARGDGTVFDYLRLGREAFDGKVPVEDVPDLSGDPFYPQLKETAQWLCSLPPGRAIINGDYDVDGCTSTVIAWRLLRRLGWSVRLFTPGRVEDHYGVNAEVLEEAIGREKMDLIMTVDCGSASLAMLDALGRDHQAHTLVIDHHARLDAPPVVSTHEVNPHNHPDILKGLGTSNPYCAAVLTYMLASQVAQIRPEVGNMLPEARILAGLAGIADITSMTAPASRHAGLGFLRGAGGPHTNLGLGRLLHKLKIEPNRLSTSKASFNIIPVLNAANRMAHANIVINLLVERDEKKLDAICESLVELNDKRKIVQREIEAEAKTRISKNAYSLLEYDEMWPIGVLGSAAGQIAQSNKIITILGGRNEKSGDIIFSGRVPTGSSVDALGLFAAAVQSLTTEEQGKIRFGGHSAAFGATLKGDATSLLPRVSQHMERALAARNGLAISGKLIDCSLVSERISMETFESLQAMEPYGEGNPEPRFLLQNVRLSLRPYAKNPTVARGKATCEGETPVPVMVFSAPNVMSANLSRVNLVGRLMYDDRARPGESKIVLKVEDVIPVEDPSSVPSPATPGGFSR
jgi:single-stranded-DNA-specific exonuclease